MQSVGEMGDKYCMVTSDSGDAGGAVLSMMSISRCVYWPFDSNIPMFAALVVIALLLMITSECAWPPGF
jgi:hypothetical protein